MEKLSQSVIVSDEQPLTTDIQYLESFTSSALNRKFSGMVHKGVFRGFECEAMAGKHVLVSSKDITGVALVERDDYVLTVRQNDDVLVDLGGIQDGYLVLEAFYQYGVTTKQVDAKSKVDAALIKFVEVGKQADHHTILCRVTIPPEAADVAVEHISYIERDYGGADIAQHVNTPDPHKQYVLREEAATTQDVNSKSLQEKYLKLPQLWAALDNALKSVNIKAELPLQASGNALNGITMGIQMATLERKGVVTLSGDYATASDELAATTAAVKRAVNYIIGTCLDKDATAVAAKQLESAFTLALKGHASGSVSINGSQGVELNVTVKKDSHRHTISYIDGLRDELDSKSDKTHLHDERYIRSFTLMDEDSVRKTVAQGKFIRFASNPNISLKWLAGGDGSEQSPHILEASVPDASTSQKGVSQLSSSTTSTSEAQSATPKAVKLAKEQAISTSVNSAKAYTNQEVAKVTGAPGAHASIKELSDAVVSNDQDIAQIEQTLPTKADKSTPLNTSGAITGGGNVGDGLTIGIKDATTGQKGAVQLSSSVSSTSQAHAATPSAVKIAYDLAKSKWAFQPASATVAGATKLSSAVNSVDETLAATPKAVKSAYDLAASKWTYQTATTARIGAVQLSSRVDLADETRAATPKAVKSAYDLAASKWAYKVATLTQAGAVQLSSATDSIDETMAATPKAVKSAHDLAARKWVFVPASKTVAGAVKLSSAINSTSVTYAATPKAVKTAYDLAASKWTHRVATTTQTGTVQLSSSVSSTSETLAATPKAVKTAHDRAVTGEQAAKAYADNLVSQLLGDAPAEHLNTLKELGDALTNNDSDIAAINAELAKKASKAIQITVSGALTGGGDLSGNVALGVQTATTGRPGVAQLSSSVTSTSETLAATPKAVKTAHDKATNALNVANSKWTHRSATTSQTGTTQLSSAVNSTSESLAATPKAIKTAYDLAASKITKAQGDGWWLPKDGTAENAKLLDGKDSSSFAQWSDMLSGYCEAAGWVTVANANTARGFGEVYVWDNESGDHAFMHITFVRSYADSSISVKTVGGHAKRIIGARVIKSANDTYGEKRLQVYVTTPSVYNVRVKDSTALKGYTHVQAYKPVVQNMPEGWTLENQELTGLDQAGGGMDTTGTLQERGQRVFSPNNRNISSAVNSTSTTVYASSAAAKTAYDKGVEALNKANSKWTFTAATSAIAGAVKLSSAINSVSETVAATPRAVKAAYDLAASKMTQATADSRYLKLVGGVLSGVLNAARGINVNTNEGATPLRIQRRSNSQTGQDDNVTVHVDDGTLVFTHNNDDDNDSSTYLFRRMTGGVAEEVLRFSAWGLFEKGQRVFSPNNRNISSAVNSTSTTVYASSAAAKTAYDLAASKMTQATADSRYVQKAAKATMTDNDGHGQASMVMNHRNGIPQVNGSAYRIDGQVDSGTAQLTFSMANNVTAGTEAPLTQVLVATTSAFDFKVDLKERGQRVFSPNNRNISSAVNSTSTTVYASSAAAKTAYDKGVEALNKANSKWTFTAASSAVAGAVKLSSAVNSTGETVAATPKAVKVAYDLAASKWTHRAATTTQTGTVQLSNSLTSTSETVAATPRAVKAAYDKANHSHPYAPTSHRHNFNQIDAGTSSGVFVASDFKGTSDRRLKTDIEPVGDMLGKLLGLKVYEYEKAGNREIGVMAQDLQELVPTLVSEGEDGYLSVSHFGLNACSIKAIQEQQQIIARQTQIIAEMAKRLSHLEETVNG